MIEINDFVILKKKQSGIQANAVGIVRDIDTKNNLFA